MATHFASATPDNYNYGDINALDGVANLTVCLWHYQTIAENLGGGGGVSVATFTKNSSGSGPLYFFKNDGGGAIPHQWGFGDGTGTVFGSNGAGETTADATWQHFAGVYDGSQSLGSRGALYVNGALITKANDTVGATFPSNANSVQLGSNGILAGWQGTMAHVKIWTASLTASEVKLECLYAEPQKTDNLILYVPLVFNTAPGATYDGTNALASTSGTPATGTVSEPPVMWPASTILPPRNNRRRMQAWKRNRFQRLSPKRPLVQYG